MKTFSLEDVSLRLIQIIKTRDANKVRHWIRVMERQKDPMVTVNLFILISRHLGQVDTDLQSWFYELYFEGFSPEVRQMWLDFVDLCSLREHLAQTA